MKKIFLVTVCSFLMMFPLVAQKSFYDAGKQYQQSENWIAAIEQYQEALRINPAFVDAWYELALCTYAIDEYSLALTYLDNAENLLINKVEAKNLKGFCLIGLQKLEEARSVFLSILKDYPNDVDARFGLAELDLFDGKISSAEEWYEAALQRQTTNRKALISLALISHELKKDAETKLYIEQAMEFHSGSPEVFYFAAYLDMLENKLTEAEGKARTAISLNKKYDPGYEILSNILFREGRYNEVVDVCDTRIASNRDLQTAWYLKALSLSKQNKIEETIKAFSDGLEISPQNEIMRSAMELYVTANTPVEDSRRKQWASYHTEKAKEALEKFYSDAALYEYQRSLRINPLDNSVRKLYAELLLRDGFPEAYLEQIKFIQKTDKSREIAEIVETYSSLTRKTLTTRWNINSFLLDKSRIKFGLYFLGNAPQLIHPEAERITTAMLADYFTSRQYFKVSANNASVEGYADAFNKARKAQQDYFGLLSFSESEREISVSLVFYSGRTGNEAFKTEVYRIGNNRYVQTLQKIVESIEDAFPVRGKIIARKDSQILVDVGLREAIEKDNKFTVVKKGRLTTADSGIGIFYNESDVYGTITITNVGEEVSQGSFVSKGFYDRINVGDEVFLVKDSPENENKDSSEADLEGQILQDLKNEPKMPMLIELIKNIK